MLISIHTPIFAGGSRQGEIVKPHKKILLSAVVAVLATWVTFFCSGVMPIEVVAVAALFVAVFAIFVSTFAVTTVALAFAVAPLALAVTILTVATTNVTGLTIATLAVATAIVALANKAGLDRWETEIYALEAMATGIPIYLHLH
ncbi:MAG: hypothetical protein Q7S66_01915 [bacterium]|nr:hypothetical protein [bacterium]